MPPSEDEVSLSDDEFGVPEDPIEQERFKHRLIATARSLERSSNSSKLIKICSQTDGLKSWRPRNMDSSATPKVIQSTSGYLNSRRSLYYQHKTTLTSHLVAGIKRRISPNATPHPHANTLRPGAIGRTCKTYWKTRQDSQDRSMDRGGAPQHVTMIVMPDTLSTSLAGLNIANQTH